MNNKEIATHIGLIAIIAILAYFAGVCRGILFERKKAIEAGGAHYIVNPTNGTVRFEFKTSRP